LADHPPDAERGVGCTSWSRSARSPAPAVAPGRGWHLCDTTVPIGIRHAVPHIRETNIVALCGADVDGWPVFPDKEFQPGHGASCQRCAQLVSEATRRS
jgi:hypothetical protein